MVSINVVRNTVMFLLNKSNKGYIGPDAFNSFCNLAQMDLFENMFFDYNAWLNKKNRRLTGSSYADVPADIRESIDGFVSYTTQTNFIYDATTGTWSYTGSDMYRTGGLSMVEAATGKKVDIEYCSKSELNMLRNSNLNAPTFMFPEYATYDGKYEIFPNPENGYYPEMFYIRTPKHPKWTYITLGNGDPMYNASDPTLQNFELPDNMFSKIVVKVLQYAGLEIREEEVMNAANTEEMKAEQKQQ